MDIISQFLVNEILNYFITEWRAETMIALIVFLLTFYIMRGKVEHYKILAELYSRDVVNATQTLKESHKALSEIKSVLQNEKDKIDRKNLLNEVQNIVNRALEKFSKGREK